MFVKSNFCKNVFIKFDTRNHFTSLFTTPWNSLGMKILKASPNINMSKRYMLFHYASRFYVRIIPISKILDCDISIINNSLFKHHPKEHAFSRSRTTIVRCNALDKGTGWKNYDNLWVKLQCYKETEWFIILLTILPYFRNFFNNGRKIEERFLLFRFFIPSLLFFFFFLANDADLDLSCERFSYDEVLVCRILDLSKEGIFGIELQFIEFVKLHIQWKFLIIWKKKRRRNTSSNELINN